MDAGLPEIPMHRVGRGLVALNKKGGALDGAALGCSCIVSH